MQFRLTYEGLLLATQRDPISGQQDKRGSRKHDIRQMFHAQLKRLWEVVPHLREGGGSGPNALVTGGVPVLPQDIASIAERHAFYGWNFVPLVTQELNLICGLDNLVFAS